MAFEILDDIKNDQHILVEAGVGIGKSFAYLVPFLLYTSYSEGAIVIDEAHNLESRVRSAVTMCLNQSELLTMIKQAQFDVPINMTARVQQEVEEAEHTVHSLFQHLKTQVQLQIAAAGQDMKYADRFFFQDDSGSLDRLKDMASALKRLSDSIQVLSTYRARQTNNTDFSDGLQEMASALSSLLCNYEASFLTEY